MLSVKNLKVRGLAPISFDLHKGDLLVVRGPSGSGKSLLLRAIADLDEASGEITLDKGSGARMAPHNWRRKVRFLSAESGWWGEQVGAHFTELARAKKSANELGLAAKLFASPVAHLSSGERQRLSFVRALEGSPKVLLLDEPTSALDEVAAELMEKKILALQKDGVILVVVTHSTAQAERLATHTLTIEDGKTRFEAR
ncbi:MAG: ATP-binding cassette domain-containing protein [Hyphomicrobiaceae bacterium]|nr:ATP-binding cassette domain-containing protein [Hyphomicrobiaceae bacterium]